MKLNEYEAEIIFDALDELLIVITDGYNTKFKDKAKDQAVDNGIEALEFVRNRIRGRHDTRTAT